MSRRTLDSLSLALGLALLLAQSLVGLSSASHAHSSPTAPATGAQHAALASQYGRLPLAFELNEGQAADSARYLAHGSGYTLALTPSEALLAVAHGASVTPHSRFALPGQPRLNPMPAMPPTLLDMRWLGANPNPVVTGEQPLPGVVNYFIGNDPAQWHTNIPTYQQVRLHNVYPGVDLVYYGNQGQLEYDFVVDSGANPAVIQLGFTGAQSLGVDLQGDLNLSLSGGTLQQAKLLVYQTVNGTRRPIAGGYTLNNGQRVSFVLGAYNPHLPLVIDPAYRFSTYLGGTSTGGDFGMGIAVDASGNAYVTGYTADTNFPTHTPLQSSNKNGGSTSTAFVTKFNAAGTALVYSTYLGGSGSTLCGGDFGMGIAVDTSGNAYVVGSTGSSDFPTTAGAFRTSLAGCGHAFVSKLNAAGSALAYSTYLGGTDGNDQGLSVAVGASGDAYVTGQANSFDFPTTPGAYQTVNHNYSAYVTKFNAAGSGLVYSTYLGGSGGDNGNSIAVDGSGNAYVTGRTDSSDFPVTVGAFQTHQAGPTQAFVTKFNAAGTALVYSTYLGGSSTYGEVGYGIAVDSGDSAYVTGDAASTDFPTTLGAFQTANAGGQDAFVTKLNAAGSALAYSTFLGGSSTDYGQGIALDGNGNAYVTGLTNSGDFPTAYPLQAHNNNTVFTSNAFVTKLNPTGSGLLYSSYLGGSGNASTSWGDYGSGIAVSWDETAYVTGEAISTNFPVVNAFQATNAASSADGGNAFVTKIATVGLAAKTTGVFRPSNGNLYLKNSNSTGYADITLDYGLPGDKPVTGDWTGKGYNSIGVDRAGKFYLRNTNTTGYADIALSFGNATDLPVAGDWTGKGYASVGVFRNGTWYLRNSNTTGPADITLNFGAAGDLPVVGDWTGKGYDSIGVYRPSLGTFFLRNSNTTGPADITVTFGASGDLPVAGDWTVKGYDSIGVYRNGTYFLRDSNTTGAPDLSFTLGIAGDQPITGPWLAPVGGLPPPVHRGPATAPSHPAATPTQREITRQ